MIFSTQNTSPLEMGWTLCRGARCEVGLGFVVRSSLHHHATSPGLTNIKLAFGLPVSFGLPGGDFQESCHSLAAIQAAWIKGIARSGSGSSVGLFIHTSAG